MSRRAAAAALCGALALPATLPAAAAAPAESGTTVTASRSSSAVVTVTRPVALSADLFGGIAGWQVRGDGRVVGIVLHSIDDRDEPVLVADLSYGFCFTAGCRASERSRLPVVAGVEESFSPDGKSRFVLPSGRYRLTVLADGAPVRARVVLPGLPRSLRPLAPAPLEVVPLEPVFSQVPQRQYVSTGDSFSSPHPVLLLDQHRALSAAGYVGHNQSCFIHGEPPPQGVYAPGCPTADPADERFSGGFGIVVISPLPVEAGGYGAALLPPGRWSVGEWHARATPITSHEALQVRLQLR